MRPFNDRNRAFDLGFRPLPWGDKGYIPGGMQPADGGQTGGQNAITEDPKPNSKPESPQSEEDGPEDDEENHKARPNVFTRLAAALTTNNTDR